VAGSERGGAFAIVKQETIDLVVLDLLLPGISGADVIRTLRRRPDVQQPVIVILSALGSECSIREGLSMGADAYITKPVEVGVVEARIAAILRQRDRLRQAADPHPVTILAFPRPAC
jgi:DNA-binding response OmpR family regulator